MDVAITHYDHIFIHLLEMRAVFTKKVKEELILILADSGKEIAPSSNLFIRGTRTKV